MKSLVKKARRAFNRIPSVTRKKQAEVWSALWENRRWDGPVQDSMSKIDLDRLIDEFPDCVRWAHWELKENYTLLHHAASCGTAEQVEKLVKAGADKNAYCGAYHIGTGTPAAFAARYGNTDAIDKLHELGASLDLHTRYIDAPVVAATFWQKPESILKLADLGASLDIRGDGSMGIMLLEDFKFLDDKPLLRKAVMQARDIRNGLPAREEAEHRRIASTGLNAGTRVRERLKIRRKKP